MRVESTPRVFRALLGLIAASLLPTSLPAASNLWTAVGPYGPGGSVHAIVVDPATPATAYVGTDGGVFKSVDAGASWSAVNVGLTGFSVAALAIDPLAPGTIYAGTDVGVFKTTNGGSEWTPLRAGIGATAVASLVMDPADDRILYAGTLSAGVFKSTDAGATWAASGNGLGSSEIRALASVSPNVWAGTPTGVFFSTDGGTTWTPSSGISLNVRALLVDPSAPATLYAGATGPLSGGGVFKSTDGGRSWAVSGVNMRNIGILSLAFDPASTSTIYAGSQGGGILAGANGGTNWSTFTDVPAVPQAMAFDPNGPTRYAGGVDGLWISRGANPYRSQTISFSTFTVNAMLADPASPATIYAAVTDAAATGGGVFKTSNGGATWAFVGGLPNNRVLTLAASHEQVPAIYAGTNGAGIFRSRDGAATWTPIDSGLTSSNVEAIVAGSGAIVYAATDADIFRSADGGDSWTATQRALSDWNVQALAIDPQDSGVVYAGTSTGVYKTTDSGASWSSSSAGLPNARILALAIDPTAPQTLYAGTISSFSAGPPTGMGVYRSTDGGLNWSAANTGIESSVVVTIATDPAGSVVYAGTTSGVYRLSRGTSNWTALNQGLSDQTVDTILVDRQTPTILYAGTTHDSVFKANVAGIAGSCAPGATTLCLNANRFQVEVAWTVRATDQAGNGMAVPLTSDTGAFWFFTSGNLELVVKVVDGRPFNGAFWVFYGALSDVEYTVTVTDTLSGQKKTYENARGQLASVADTAAFPGATSGASRELSGARPHASPPSATVVSSGASGAAVAAAPCVADGTTLCLNGGRFRVQVDWVAAAIGQSGHGQTAPFSSDSGSFWFFSPGNLELNIKVVDGRAVTGHFWVFYGALSDVAYTITVTDTQTGAQRTYVNPQGQLASVADTSAF